MKYTIAIMTVIYGSGIHKIHRGIPNTDGNACFMNAATQLVLNIPAMRNAIMSSSKSDRITTMTARMAREYAGACDRSCDVFASFHRVMREEFGMYKDSSNQQPSQEDITEFIDKWLSALDKPVLRHVSFTVKSVLSHPFLGNRETVEPYTRLSIPVLPENDIGLAQTPVNLSDLITSTMKHEVVEYNNTTYSKKLCIVTLPDILHVSINRYTYTDNAAAYIYRPVVYNHILDLSSEMCPSDSVHGGTYRLAGLAIQKPASKPVRGVTTTSAGHYITIFTDEDDASKTTVYNDDITRPGESLLAYRDNVYVLVYIRTSRVADYFPKWTTTLPKCETRPPVRYISLGTHVNSEAAGNVLVTIAVFSGGFFLVALIAACARGFESACRRK